MTHGWSFLKQPSVPVCLRYEFSAAGPLEGPLKLALEEASRFHIEINGRTVENEADGWWTDRSLRTVPVPAHYFQRGINRIDLSLTYDPSYPGLEIIYLLGRFSIQAYRKITVGDFPKRLTLGDVRQQGLLFYGGHIQYSFSVNHEPGSKGKVVLCCPDYAGAALRIAVNGEKRE